MSKKNIIVLLDMGISQHEISRRLKISHRCIHQTFSKFHTVATKSGAGRPPKVTDREKSLTKLQQFRDDTASLVDLVRYVNTNSNLSIGRSTINRILQAYNIVSYIAARKVRMTPTQRRNRLTWYYDYLNWSINDKSNVVFFDENNFEALNRKNRIYIRRFCNDRTRFERSQKRFHKDSGIVYVSQRSIKHIHYTNRCILKIKNIFSLMRYRGGVYNFGNPYI